jgi:lipopolysaccharide/colanic/teichoic acid biosynthesis glycosyltransferase
MAENLSACRVESNLDRQREPTDWEVQGNPSKQTNNAHHGEHSFAVVTHRSWRGKRVFDIVGTVSIALVLSPLIAVIALWLHLTPGAAIFGHRRIGRNGRRFTCYKFRTMVPNADQVLDELFKKKPELRDEWILHHKIKDDPRITRIGAFLRKTSLDELPQLWNVIKGDMSLVGPRPIVDQEIFKYGRAFGHYLAVKPGLTGLWQVTGRNDTSYQKRVALDRMYAMRSCLGLDTRILFKTVLVVVARRGAY